MNLFDLQKIKPLRSSPYLKWVKSQPCCYCGSPADDAHHIIGVGRGAMGSKDSDLFTMPLCRGCHTLLHNDPSMYGAQLRWLLGTLEKAVNEGVISVN